MALQKDITTKTGVRVVDAYLKVEEISILNKVAIRFNLKYYVDVEKGAFQIKKYACDYDLDSTNPIAQAYEYLKTLDEFIDSIDC